MLSVNINRDPEEYEEPVMAGFNAKQTIAILKTLLIGAGIACALHFLVGLSILLSVYAALPVCVPIMLSTFGRDGDISAWEKMKKTGSRNFYISTEVRSCREGNAKFFVQEKQRLQKDKKTTLRQNVARFVRGRKKHWKRR